MTEVNEDFAKLEVDANLLKNVRYYLSGEIDENVLELLRNAGAERMNYFSDYVTHLICGKEPEDTDLTDAIEVYEIPAVTTKWVLNSCHLKRILSTKPYLYNINKLFSNLNFCFSSIGRDRNALWAIITYNGGCVQLNLNRNCNYLVTTNTFSEKYLKAQSLLNESIVIVTPDWILESVRNKCFARVELYHPRLILWPKIIKHESTTAITGFEPDELGLNEGNLENILPDSTQALLEELKQRMPWNQPQTSPSSDLAPPNVIAPSYTGSKLSQQLQDINQQQSVQQRLFNQQQQLNIQKTSQSQQLNFLPPTSQVPRSIVHHPPQSPLPQNQQLQFPVNQQVAFSQANLTSAQRLKIIEQMQQHRAQRLQQQQQQNQFNQLQQQQRVQQLQQQVGQLQENQMGQVNQQQQQIITQVNQLRQPVGQAQPQQQQQVAQGGQQQLILTGQNQQQENPRQLLQNIQQGQQQQLVQNQQLRQVTSQQVTSMAQLQMVQNQQQQHSNLNQLSKSTPTSIQSQQQLLSPQQLLQRQIQNQHLLKSQHILQNQQQQLQNQLNQQSQINQQQGQQQQNQINQQLLQTQQPQDLQQQLNQQSHLEQQLTQQNQLNQQPQQQQQQQQITQNQLNQRQLNQLNQHLLQNQLVQQNQQQSQLRQNQINVQQQQLNQLSQQQINQNRLNIQQQQQNKILQSQFNQQQQQQIINQQTVVGPQNQQNVLQQQFGSPTSQQFNQQQTFVQQAAFNQPQQPQQQLIQTQQSQQQVIACQQQQQVQVQQPQQAQQQQILAQQQQLKPQQIIGQPQLVNQKLNIQQIGGQQHILLQQPQQVQTNQESSPQRAANAHLWQQQQQPPPPPPTPQQQPQINIQRHPNVQGQGPRLQWAPNQQGGVVLPQRQYIHLDEQTHQQLQQMSPEDRALFVQKLHKHRQQVLQSRMQAQQQQRAGHILIRGGVPLGLNSQQQMQWLQQQAKQQGVVLQQNIQQAVPQGTIVQQANPSLQHAPGLSPIQQQSQFTEQNQQLQLQRQQQQQLRLQQLQLHQQQQREQAQKSALQQQQPAPPPPLQQPQQPTVVRALVQGQVVEGAGVAGPAPVVVDPNVVQSQNPLVVNSKTKTALANMLNTRLQSGGSTLSENIAEPSAAGTLKLMTAQHNAALNTGTRPHDLLFFQQRRIINRPNGEVIRPQPATSVPPGPQVDPPKLQYSPRNSVPLQHRPGTYYGHNPNLKLPPDLFLLGCVFVVVELERFLDESMPGWQKKIEKHGGEIEKQYCNRVTHVICETQRHGVVMQALRDFKRCVTLYWLSDVINRKQVLPPWIALHLPTMYWDTAPASKHLICLTGFQGTERDRVKHMIKYIGAGLTTYFSKHNTLLITTKGEGPKYHHAKKWGIPIVNVQWLTDIMLGHFTALNQTEHVKYQHFVEPPNFSFDPLLVPNLMHAWKMPINISQESYEKVKRSASPVVLPPNSKAKKIKTELVSMTDENDNEEDMVLRATATYRILFSMCPDVDELKKIVRQLGGIVVKSFHDCTHLLMPQLKRTHKLLCCLCIGTYIIPDSWLRDSYTAGKFLDESNYSHDTKEFNSEFKCDFNQTLSTNNRNKLFEGKHFFVTPSVVPRKKELIELIECSGGMVEKNRRTLAQIEATNVNSPYSYVILTHENDLHLVADLLKNKKDKIRIVCNSELILSAILKQTFEVEPYAVKFL